jgi:hypothetical protein
LRSLALAEGFFACLIVLSAVWGPFQPRILMPRALGNYLAQYCRAPE